MCVKILFFPLEDQRSWRQFKIGKVLVHFHLKLISSHCRGEKPYWQCKKHTALLTLYPSFPSPHPSFCFNFYFLCMGVLSACVSVCHVHNLGQQGRKFRNNRHKYKKKIWDWVDCLIWWRHTNNNHQKTHHIYFINLNWGGGFVVYSWMRKRV